MSKRLLKLAAVAFSVGILAYAGGASAATPAMSGATHDLRADTGSTEICITCHTPHNALGTLVPLWNHATTAVTTYTLYTSNTLNATLGQPSGVTQACLSCHDGTVAIDSFGGATGSNTITAPDLLGTDLSNDHPVSFTYDSTLATADGGLVTPASTSQVTANIPLYGGKLECASCHNVHGGPALTHLLRVTSVGSEICAECHLK